MDASHPLPLTLGPENGSRPKAVVSIASFNICTKNNICNLFWGKKKFDKTGVQEMSNCSTCAVKVNLNSGISSLLRFGNAIKAFY